MAEAEANELVKQAEKAENKKNMFFKKAPDWEKAAELYQKAARIYGSPAVKRTDAAIYAYDKASFCHANNGALFFAGTALESAAIVLRDDTKSPKEAAAKFQEASAMHLRNNNLEKACETLIKAAKAQVEVDGAAAIENYLEVMTLYEDNDKHIYISDTWRAVLGLMLKNGMYQPGLKLLHRMLPTMRKLEQVDYLHKAQLCIIIIHLYMGDRNAADAFLSKFEGLGECAEGRAAMGLVEAFETGDFEKVAELTKDQTFTLLENQVARTARQLAEKCKEIAGDMTGKYEEVKRPVILEEDDYDSPPEDKKKGKGKKSKKKAVVVDDGDDMDDLM